MTAEKARRAATLLAVGRQEWLLGLLASAGVGMLVLVKHADFLWDFRGDKIHPRWK